MWSKKYVKDFNFEEISYRKKGSPSYIKIMGINLKGYPDTLEVWSVNIQKKHYPLINLSFYLNRINPEFFVVKIHSSLKMLINPSAVLCKVLDLDKNSILRSSKIFGKKIRLNFIVSQVISCSCKQNNILIFKNDRKFVPVAMSFNFNSERKTLNGKTSLSCWGIDEEQPYGIEDVKFFLKRINKKLKIEEEIIPEAKEVIKGIMCEGRENDLYTSYLLSEVFYNFQSVILEFD